MRPARTGSGVVSITIGMVVVSSFSALVRGMLDVVSTSGWRDTSRCGGAVAVMLLLSAMFVAFE